MSLPNMLDRDLTKPHSWANDHPLAIAALAWFLASLPGIISFVLWFWNEAACRQPWLGMWALRTFWLEGFDSTGPGIVVAAICVVILRACGPLGDVFTGRKGRSVVMIGLVVSFTSLLVALALTIIGQLLIMALGSACS